jgi:hypothetical protein
MRIDGQSGDHTDNPIGPTLMGVRGGLSVFTQSEVSFDSRQIEAACREAYPLEESPGTRRNRTEEFQLQLVRGGPFVVRSSRVEACSPASRFLLGDSN